NVTGSTANDKVYDSPTAATFSTAAAVIASGVISGDVVAPSASGAVGMFATKHVGNNISVTVSSLAFIGPQAGDYKLAPQTLTANITPAPLTVTGITADDKVYDGTTTAVINTPAARLGGLFPFDTVTLNLPSGAQASAPSATLKGVPRPQELTFDSAGILFVVGGAG